MSEYIGKRVIPRHDGVWDANKSYEPLCLVLAENGDSYISRREVPAGVPLSNERYWSLCQQFSEQLKLMGDHMDRTVSSMKQANAETLEEAKKRADENIAAINKTVSDTVTAVNKTCEDTVAAVNQTAANTVADVKQKTDTVVADTRKVQKDVTTRMEQIEARQEANVTASTVPNADYAAEVVDARVDADGNTYPSLGDAFRSHKGYLEKRGPEIFHEQMTQHFLSAIYGEARKELHQGALNYDLYKTSTFSGWVSEYTIADEFRAYGISVYLKAREEGEAIRTVRIAIAEGSRDDGNLIFESTQSVDIQPGEAKEVSCVLPNLTFKKGSVYYILAEADQICSSGFGEKWMQDEYTSWYTTNGNKTPMQNYQRGTRYQLAAVLTGYEMHVSRTDRLDAAVEALREDSSAYEGAIDVLEERQGEIEEQMNQSFTRQDYTENVQDLLPGNTPRINYTTSTFTGWAAPIGPAKDFNSVVFRIKAREENPDPVDKIRCVVSVFDKNGEVLADVTQEGFQIQPGEEREVHFRLPDVIPNTEGRKLYAGFTCDQFISVYTSNVQENLNHPDYGAVTYTANGGTPPFDTSRPLNRWTNIHDPDKKNQVRTYITVERVGKRFRLTDAQLEQVGQMLTEAELSERQQEKVCTILDAWMEKQGVMVSLPPRIILPDRYQAVVGDTLQLFYRGIVEHPYPYQFNIEFVCAIGKNTARYFEVTPTASQAKEYKLTVNVRDAHDRILATKDTVLEVVSVSAPQENRTVLCIGDSLTGGGYWCAEAHRRLTQAGGSPAGLELPNIEFIGTKKNGTAGFEGYGGWTWGSYLAKPSYTTLGMWVYCSHNKDSSDQHSLWKDANGNVWSMETIEAGRIKFTRYGGHSGVMPSGAGTLQHHGNAAHTGDIQFTATAAAEGNPFWDSEKEEVNFQSYCKRNGFSGIDYLYTLLTWNGYGAGNAEPQSAQLALHVNKAKQLIRIFHEQYPDAKVKVMGIQLPSLDGGCGANYGAANGYSNAYRLVRSVMGMNLAYQELANDKEFSGYVEFVNVSGQFDSENNMPYAMKPVNTRSTDTEKVGTNGVHPSKQGYLQIGDAAFRNMAARVK